MSSTLENSPAPPVSTEKEILPRHLKPIHYDITIEPHLEEAVYFDGSVVIDLAVVEDTSSITLNAVDLEILETEVLVGDGSVLPVSNTNFDSAKETLTIKVEGMLTIGQNVKLKQSFKGSLLHNTSGLFRSPVVQKDGTTKWMVSTQFEATDARRVFPSFDEPGLKATFSITLVADKTLTCLGNMDVAYETDAGEGKKAVTFNRTPLMSTYIVAFAIGDLKMIETTDFRVPVRVYASADKNIEHGRFALQLASRTLKAFEKIFDIEFPLPKLDLIAIPGEDGAMENWGLVTFADCFLLVDETDSSATALRLAGSVIVHELAHQWFGNLVTMEFWDGLWLNESFADWAELYAWETLEPSWQMWQNYATEGFQRALTLDSNKASHPIEAPVSNATEVAQVFDSISYDKGCAVIRMVSKQLGIDVFIKGVQKYLKKAAYGNTVTGDLWDALSEVSGQDVANIMATWTQKVGYPVVHVVENPAGESVTLTQHRFLQDGTQDPDYDKVLYPLKLRVRTKNGIDDETTLYERTRTLELPSDFFKLNADHTGLFRVSYPPHRLRILGQNARDGHLSPEDKIGLISDALAVATSGHSRTSSVLTLLEVFDEETNFFVWKQIMEVLNTISGVWGFEEKPVKDGLKLFKMRLISKCLEKKGWKFNDGEDQVDQMLKALIFSNSGEDPKVAEAAHKMFEAFLSGEDDAINTNIRESVFAIALEHGGAKEYEAIQEASKTTHSIGKRDICMNSLGYALQPDFISRTLSFAMRPEIIAINKTYDVLETLTKHAPGKEALWIWFKDSMEEVNKKLGGGLGRLAMFVQLCTEHLSTRTQWNDVTEFFKDKDTEEYDMYLAQSLEMILTRSKWVERDRDDVKLWLKTNGYYKAN